MGVFGTDENVKPSFKGFLAGVYYNGKFIGEMKPGKRSKNIPVTSRVQLACDKTSITHANSDPKQEIFFEWKAPVDLPEDAIVELR